MKEALTIQPVKSTSDMKDFLRFPWQLYQNDPKWVPPLYFDRQALLDREKHPFFQFATAEYFLARRGDRLVGTIAAFVNRRHNEFHDENAAHFGFFEVMQDDEAASGLLQAACDWGKQQGKNNLLGPANFSTNHTYGLLVDGFDRPPVIEMTYNPAYYVDYIESAGFEKAMNLWAWYFSIPDIFGPNGEKIPPKLARVVEKIKTRYNIKIREINMKDWDNEILRFSEVYQSAWSKNWGFVPLTNDELKHLAESLKIVVDPRITLFAEIDGKMVGASVPLPDINEILVQVRPGPSSLSAYMAAIPLLMRRRKVKMLRIFAMGVIEEYRAKGIDALFYYETVKRALRAGYLEGEASWILETNDMMNRSIKMLGGEIYKTYRIYQKTLA